ncbi:hypothetical protein CCHL11_07851 [Colletotrichum chlorophyti]|uniref:Hydrophobin n=1 Tax=Colletotrichum chlorophyti TaxID=708187 RepID=A0A1Q8RR36_9PEZI|nr:hypothetical protein CCHL11_07851 [Colletotrichum chlorophyti]
MHLLSITLLFATASALPVSLSPRLINISPDISPKINLSEPVSCVGIAACNPVSVNNGVAAPAPTATPAPPPPPPHQTPSGGGNSLINISPILRPDLNLSGLLKCLGIAACNPVTVNTAPGQ